MMYEIIVLEKLRFHPSTRKREAGFFKNLHSGERLLKDAFSATGFTEYIRVGKTKPYVYMLVVPYWPQLVKGG